MCVKWIKMAHNLVQWQVIMIMNVLVSQKYGTSW